MNRVKKMISLIMCVSIIINFVLSSFSGVYAYDPKLLNIPSLSNSKKTCEFVFDGEQLNNGTIWFKVKPATTAVYEIAVYVNDEAIYYDITNTSGQPLAIATSNNEDLPRAAEGGRAKVCLVANTEYYLFIYTNNVKYQPVRVEFTYSGSTPITLWNLPSSVYSSAGSSPRSVNGVTLQIAQSVRHDDEGYIEYIGVPSQSWGGSTHDPQSIKGLFIPTIVDIDETKQSVDLPQKIITWLVIFGIADQMNALIRMMFGNVTLDNLLFNEYANTTLDFYSGSKCANPFLRSGILNALSEYYSVFRRIAISFYLILLLYIGIRIILKSTAGDKEKYKSMIMTWLVGVLLLLLFPIVIKYLILMNNTLIGLLNQHVRNTQSMGDTGLPDGGAYVSAALSKAISQKEKSTDADIMNKYRKMAVNTGNIGFALIYIYILFKLFTFLIFYFQRLITVLILIAVFPFVAISYVLDNGKIFKSWLKELMINIYTQFFQAALYLIVMFIITALVTNNSGNVLLVCIGISFISKGDQLLRTLFPSLLGGGKTDTGSLSSVQSIANTAVAMNIASSIGEKGKAMGKKFSQAKKAHDEFTDARLQYSTAKNERTLADLDSRIKDQMEAPLKTDEGIQQVLAGATMKKRDGVADSLGPNATSEEQKQAEQRNLEQKFDNLQQLAFGLANPATREKVSAAIAERRAQMTPEQREKFDTELNAAVHLHRLTTKTDIDGRPLTDREINFSANVIFELEQAMRTSKSAKYSDLRAMLHGKKAKGGAPGIRGMQFTTKKKVPVDRSIKTEQDAKAWEKKHPGRSAYKYVDQTVSYDEYFALDAHGNPIGEGFKGRVLVGKQKSEFDQASAILGGRDGIGNGATMAETVDAATGIRMLSDGSGRVHEDANTGAQDVYTMTDDEKRAAHERVDASGRSIVDKMVSEFSGADATDQDREDLREAAELVMELAAYNEALHPTDPAKKKAGVSSDEMFKLTNKLTQLSSGNAKVATMLRQSVTTDRAGAQKKVTTGQGKKQKTVTQTIAATSESSSGIVVNLGTTIEGLRAMSAKTVLTDKKMDGKKRKKVAEDALEVLTEISGQVSQGTETLDAVAAAVFDHSELDAYIGDSATYEDAVSLEDGLERASATNEEQYKKKFEREMKEKAMRMVDERVAELRRNAMGKAITLGKTTIDATAGNVMRVTAAITAQSLMLGADSAKPDVGSILMAGDVGMSVGDMATHPLQSVGNAVGQHPIQSHNKKKKKEMSQRTRAAMNEARQNLDEARGNAAAGSYTPYSGRNS